MEPELFDKHSRTDKRTRKGNKTKEKQKSYKGATKEKQDPVRVNINVPLGGLLAGPAVAAPPAAPAAPPRVVAPAVRPRTAQLIFQ